MRQVNPQLGDYISVKYPQYSIQNFKISIHPCSNIIAYTHTNTFTLLKYVPKLQIVFEVEVGRRRSERE